VADDNSPTQTQPGERESGTFHYNPGNMSGKKIGRESDGDRIASDGVRSRSAVASELVKMTRNNPLGSLAGAALAGIMIGFLLITGAASAQTAPPVPAAATNAPVATVVNAPMAAARVAKPQNKRRKKVTLSFVVVVSNSRSVALSELDATPSGGTLPKTIVSNLAPGQKLSVTVATEKSCVFNLHGVYADGSSTDSTSVDLCKDKRVNLVE
jgi:hypothetical protein